MRYNEYMDMSHIPEDKMFANDHYWNQEAAIMLGRFLALSQFKDHVGHDLMFAVSPEFFYGLHVK